MSRKTIHIREEDLGDAFRVLRARMIEDSDWTYISFKFGQMLRYRAVAPVTDREMVIEVPEFFVHVITRRDSYHVIASHSHAAADGGRPDRHIHIDEYVTERPSAEDVVFWAEKLVEMSAI